MRGRFDPPGHFNPPGCFNPPGRFNPLGRFNPPGHFNSLGHFNSHGTRLGSLWPHIGGLPRAYLGPTKSPWGTNEHRIQSGISFIKSYIDSLFGSDDFERC